MSSATRRAAEGRTEKGAEPHVNRGEEVDDEQHDAVAAAGASGVVREGDERGDLVAFAQKKLAAASVTDPSLKASATDASMRFLHAEWAKGSPSVPFLARYRRDRTGGLSERELRVTLDAFDEATAMRQRLSSMLQALRESGRLTGDVQRALEASGSLRDLEAVFAPFKSKRSTLAQKARDAGLEPLSVALLGTDGAADKERALSAAETTAIGALSTEKVELLTALVSEAMYTCPVARSAVRDALRARGVVVTEQRSDKVKALQGKSAAELEELERNFRKYLSFSKPVSRLQPTEWMAISRGEDVGILRVKMEFANDADAANARWAFRAGLKQAFAAGLALNPSSRWPRAKDGVVRAATEEAFAQHALPAATTVLRRELDDEAEESRIRCFTRNLRGLLLARPLHGVRSLLAIDPGFAHGSKAVVLDGRTGALLDKTVFYVLRGDAGARVAELHALLRKHDINRIAIGDGTGSQETEAFVADAVAKWKVQQASSDLTFSVVSETGASVYSVSEAAAAELGDLDVLFRGAVSIGRRLLDPLSELIKIPPMSLGVGQYQHDAASSRLTRALDAEVSGCVACVGVNVETASVALLEKLPGIGPATAAKLTAFAVRSREKSQGRVGRADLLRQSVLTSRQFEAAAGFLRFPSSPEPLDATAVHPESYAAVAALRHHLGAEGQNAMETKLKELYPDVLPGSVAPPTDAAAALATRCGFDGVDSLRLAVRELLVGARDVRLDMPTTAPTFVSSTSDVLRHGAAVQAVVGSITDFGVFCSVGLHRQALLPRGEWRAWYRREGLQPLLTDANELNVYYDYFHPGQTLSQPLMVDPATTEASEAPTHHSHARVTLRYCPTGSKQGVA